MPFLVRAVSSLRRRASHKALEQLVGNREGYTLGLYSDNGKENGNYFIVCNNIGVLEGIMEKTTEAIIVGCIGFIYCTVERVSWRGGNLSKWA